LDTWTVDQIAIMKAGGNSKCLRYFEEQKIEKDATLKERYNSQAAAHYKEIVAVVAKGKPAPAPTAVGLPKNHTSANNDDPIEALVLTDPSMTYSQAVVPALNFLSFLLDVKKNVKPKMMAIVVYLIVGVIYYSFPNNYIIRKTMGAFLILPFIAISLLWANVTRTIVTKRLPAFKSAHNLLWERVQAGRARRRKDGHDIYLPPNAEKTKFGIIFFPGALVNHTAYAPIACKLSDEGILVVVLSMEPTRFIADLEINKKMALIAMYEVLAEGDVNVEEWVLAGHSAGAATAMKLAVEMKPGISKLVMCGIGANQMGIKTLREAAVNVLVMNGSNDALVNHYSEEKRKDFRNTLPPTSSGGKGKTEYVTIDGGNHAGFGHYGPQTFPRLDGERTITLDQQQDAFVQKTVEFLFQKAATKQD
jgi:hypothetical protein